MVRDMWLRGIFLLLTINSMNMKVLETSWAFTW